MSEAVESNETPSVALPPPRLLVVDDEPDICDILVDWLTPRGYVVETAGDADEALARLAQGGVDGMILDLHLPGRDGLEVMEESRELDPELAILIMTGDDRFTTSALFYYWALRAAGVPAELHVYPTGGHGYGLRPSEHTVSTWPKRCEDWLRSRGVLKR